MFVVLSDHLGTYMTTRGTRQRWPYNAADHLPTTFGRSPKLKTKKLRGAVVGTAPLSSSVLSTDGGPAAVALSCGFSCSPRISVFILLVWASSLDNDDI